MDSRELRRPPHESQSLTDGMRAGNSLALLLALLHWIALK
jgi:hypothetical protein